MNLQPAPSTRRLTTKNFQNSPAGWGNPGGFRRSFTARNVFTGSHPAKSDENRQNEFGPGLRGPDSRVESRRSRVEQNKFVWSASRPETLGLTPRTRNCQCHRPAPSAYPVAKRQGVSAPCCSGLIRLCVSKIADRGLRGARASDPDSTGCSYSEPAASAASSTAG